jgi:hypothetical protein
MPKIERGVIILKYNKLGNAEDRKGINNSEQNFDLEELAIIKS